MIYPDVAIASPVRSVVN